MNIADLEIGIGKYIKQEVIPNLPDGFHKFLVYTGSILVLGKGEQLIQKHLPTLEVMDIIGKNGDVDIDKLYAAAKEGMKAAGTVEYKGMTFNSKDVDSLYKFIAGGKKDEDIKV